MRNNVSSNALRNLIHFAISVFMVVIYNGKIIGRLLHLMTEERNDGLSVVVGHIRLVETVEQSDLAGIKQ